MEGETPLKDNCMIISEKFEDGLATFPPAMVMVPSPCEGESTRTRIHALWNGIYASTRSEARHKQILSIQSKGNLGSGWYLFELIGACILTCTAISEQPMICACR